MGASQKAFDITVAYVKERKVFGKSLMSSRTPSSSSQN